jgi:hypothetical protein
MKLGDGEHLYKDLSYINVTPDEMDETLKRTGQNITIKIDDKELIPEDGVISLGKLADKDTVGMADLDEEVAAAMGVAPLRTYDHRADFPEEGSENLVYMDMETSAVYLWHLAQYYRVGVDYTQIKVLNGGDSNNG